MSSLANYLLFQLGWFASVLAAARETPWLGVLAVISIVALHLATRGTPRELLLIGSSAFLGIAVDSFLMHTGIVTYMSRTPPQWLAPAWILAMWANLAITLRHSLSWLGNRPALAAVLGIIAGPLAYWGASGLGAAELAWPVVGSAVLALVWGLALPALFWVSEKLR